MKGFPKVVYLLHRHSFRAREQRESDVTRENRNDVTTNIWYFFHLICSRLEYSRQLAILFFFSCEQSCSQVKFLS